MADEKADYRYQDELDYDLKIVEAAKDFLEKNPDPNTDTVEEFRIKIKKDINQSSGFADDMHRPAVSTAFDKDDPDAKTLESHYSLGSQISSLIDIKDHDDHYDDLKNIVKTGWPLIPGSNPADIAFLTNNTAAATATPAPDDTPASSGLADTAPNPSVTAATEPEAETDEPSAPTLNPTAEPPANDGAVRDVIAQLMTLRREDGVETRRVGGGRNPRMQSYLPDELRDEIDTSSRNIYDQIKTGIADLKNQDEWRYNKAMLKPLSELVALGLEDPYITEDNRNHLELIQNQLDTVLIPRHDKTIWWDHDDQAVMQTLQRIKDRADNIILPEIIAEPIVTSEPDIPTTPSADSETDPSAPLSPVVTNNAFIDLPSDPANPAAPAAQQPAAPVQPVPPQPPAPPPPPELTDMEKLADRLYENPSIHDLGETLVKYLKEDGRNKPLTHDERNQVEQRLLERANEDHGKWERKMDGSSDSPTLTGSYAKMGASTLNGYFNKLAQLDTREMKMMNNSRISRGQLRSQTEMFKDRAEMNAEANFDKYHDNWAGSVSIELDQATENFDQIAMRIDNKNGLNLDQIAKSSPVHEPQTLG